MHSTHNWRHQSGRCGAGRDGILAMLRCNPTRAKQPLPTFEKEE
jgi:hypothetical protein